MPRRPIESLRVYVSDVRVRLAAFGKAFDARPCCHDRGARDRRLAARLDLSPTSRFNFRKVLRTAFEFAVMRGYAIENPVIKTGRVKADDTPPGILSPEEVGALLASAHCKNVSSVALSAFAGLRDAEIGRLTWDRVDLEGGHVKIDAAVAKTSSRRLIPISSNLRAWLVPHVQKSGHIRPSQRTSYLLYSLAKKKAASVLAEAGRPCPGLQKWPHNALRHSFVSYRLALVANAAQVAEECGHGVEIMKKNYRELVTQPEAEAWFSVRPPSTG